MKRYLLAAAAVSALCVAGSANAAVNTALILWNGSAVETATGIGQADLLGSSLGDINILASQANRDGLPNNGLDENNIFIVNTSTTTAETLNIIAGANGYIGPDNKFKLSGTINLSLGSADLKGFFFADNSNSLNGQTESVTGVQINSFDSGVLSGPQAFSFNGLGFDGVTTPYGMAEWLQLTLQPGAAIGVQSLSMEAVEAVPELPTWTYSLMGFGLLGLAAFKRQKTALHASL